MKIRLLFAALLLLGISVSAYQSHKVPSNTNVLARAQYCCDGDPDGGNLASPVSK